jgi:mRNA interferase MazF
LRGTQTAGRMWGQRGEIRWYTFRLPDKRRPVLILTRNDVIDRLNEIIVVPATRTIRGLTTEVVLTVDDGMPAACAFNFDHVSLAQRSRIVLCYLSETRWAEVRDALLIACGFGRSSD